MPPTQSTPTITSDFLTKDQQDAILKAQQTVKSSGLTPTVNVDFSKPVSVDSLTTPPPVTFPEQTKDVTNYNAVTTSIVPDTPYDQQVTDLQKEFDTRMSSIESAISGISGEAETESGIKQELGIPGLENTVNDLTAQLNSLNAQAKAEMLTAEGKQIPLAAISGEQQIIERNRAIRSLTIGASLAAAQGNLLTANERLSEAMRIKYKDPLEKIDRELKLLELNRDKLQGAQRQQADARQLILEFQREKMELEREDETSFNQTKNEALLAGMPTSVAAMADAKFRSGDLNGAYSLFSPYLKKATGTGGPGLLSGLPASVQSRLLGISTAFGNRTEVKRYNSTVDSINIVNGIDPNSKNPADHQQIVYAFAKALDPDSAVKEGEYETIRRYAQSTFDAYGKQIQNAINGTGFLSASAISNIQTTMNNVYKNRKPIYDNIYSETSRILDNVAGAPIAQELLIDYTGGVMDNGDIDKPTNYLSPEDKEDTFDDVVSGGFWSGLWNKLFGN